MGPASDDHRYPGGRICTNTPVHADHLDQLVWDHITSLISDPALIQAEVVKRLAAARTSGPTVAEYEGLGGLAETTNTIAQMITAFPEQLLTIDEPRSRIPDRRARETNLGNQLQAIDAGRGAYLKLARTSP